MNLESEKYWKEVKRALEEETSSGYKLACIEARKVLIQKLRDKKAPTENLSHTLALFGHKFTNLTDLKAAVEKTEKIINTFDYKLSNFEAEDIVEAFSQAVSDLEEMDQMSLSKKMMISVVGDEKRKVNYYLYLGILLGFLLFVRILANTTIGLNIVKVFVSISNFIFSWFLLVSLVAFGIFIFIIITFAGLDKRKTKIKSIKEK